MGLITDLTGSMPASEYDSMCAPVSLYGSRLCSPVRFLLYGFAFPAAVDNCHNSQWLTAVAADCNRLRYFVGGSARSCGDGPTCGT